MIADSGTVCVTRSIEWEGVLVGLGLCSGPTLTSCWLY